VGAAVAAPGRLSDWVAVVRPRLGAPLFHPAGVARLLRAARRLPGACLHVLELRLSTEPGPLDVAVRLTDAGHSRRLAREIQPSHHRTFLRRWREKEEPQSPPLRSVWCEFDLDRAGCGRLPAPVVCAKLPSGGAPPRDVVERLVAALQPRGPTAAQRRLLSFCLEALSPPAFLLYLFSLSARGTEALRLEILGLDPAGILDHLDAVAPHTVPQASAAVELLAGAERLHLSYDVGERVEPRIGVEGSFPAQPRREPRWAALFDRLVERGLCAPGKRDAALAWPGCDTFWTAPAAWPVAVCGSGGLCFRALSHVKVVCGADRRPEAKLYLACGFRPADQAEAGSAGEASAGGRRAASAAAFSS
jgi:hypothetical protein